MRDDIEGKDEEPRGGDEGEKKTKSKKKKKKPKKKGEGRSAPAGAAAGAPNPELAHGAPGPTGAAQSGDDTAPTAVKVDKGHGGTDGDAPVDPERLSKNDAVACSKSMLDLLRLKAVSRSIRRHSRPHPGCRGQARPACRRGRDIRRHEPAAAAPRRVGADSEHDVRPKRASQRPTAPDAIRKCTINRWLGGERAPADPVRARLDRHLERGERSGQA